MAYCTIIPGNLPYNAADPTINVFVASGISVDALGQATIAGTAGAGLPTTSGVIQPTFPNSLNNTLPNAGFALQLNPTALAINYATYVPGTDWILGMTTDGQGNLYVAGSTLETNLPVSANAYQKALLQNQVSGFVAKMNSNGTAVLGGTYLGSGTAGTGLAGIAIDSSSNMFVGGGTSAADFPLVNPFISEWKNGISDSDMVLAEISADFSSLLFGSFLSSTDQVYSSPQFYGITVDGQDNPIVVGETEATDFPTTPNSFQPTVSLAPSQHQIGFVTQLDMSTPVPSVCLGTWGLNFGLVAVGTSSEQTLNVTNCGNAALSIASVISSQASVTANDTCGSIAPGAICPVSVIFAPQNASAVNGTLTLNDNTVISPQIVLFSAQGAGNSIGLEAASSGSTSATVTAGSTATYSLVIGGSGIGGTASISCTNAPKGAVCSVPSTISLSSSTAQPLNVTVSTTSRSATSTSRNRPTWLWAVALLCLATLPRLHRSRPRLRSAEFSSLAILLAACSCGGSGNGSQTGPTGTQPNPNGTPAGTYTLMVNATVGSASESLPLSLTVQ